MDERTRSYVKGRFSDHYRSSDVSPPPKAKEREWGYIPWPDPGSNDTRMVRHKSLAELGDLSEFLEQASPRHVYFSASKYETPGASTMDGKEWQSSDLVFDLDADHLPNVTLGEDSYAEMLAKCKGYLQNLLTFLEDDFGFEDMEVTFSGGRGYHVHVRDEEVQSLKGEARREFVDYVTAKGIDGETLTNHETNPIGADSQATAFNAGSGWPQHVHQYVSDRLLPILELGDDEAVKRQLTEIDGVESGRADALVNFFDGNKERLRTELIAGYKPQVNVDNPAFKRAFTFLWNTLVDEAVAEQMAAVDEPVTTDINRLIRFPGSIHGESGLEVVRLTQDELDDFDPLVDAIPETFSRHDIRIAVTEDMTVELRGETREFEAATEAVVPEDVGMFLMTRGKARKLKE